MAVFTYRALDASTKRVTGTLVAESPRQVREQLRARGLTVEDVVQRGGDNGGRGARGSGAASSPWRGRRRHAAAVLTFVRELSTLTGAGIPLLDAIRTLSEQYGGRFRSVLLVLEDRVAAGASLADAMREQPAAFDDVTIHMTEVGEATGKLDAVLDRLADFQERRAAMRNRVGTALIYPAIVLLVTVAVSVLLMTFVVPRLLGTLLEAGRPPPWPTRVVKAVSDVLVEYWWAILSGVGVAGFAVVAALATPRGRAAWHAAQLRVPLFGNLIRKQAIARVAVVMSTLLRSGVVFVRALQVARQATPNTVLRAALARCEEAVTSGADIAAALKETRAFPPMVVQIFAVGQESGRLEDMLDRLANDYDRQTATIAARLTAVLEPALILIMVAVVGFVAMATILPMLQAADAF